MFYLTLSCDYINLLMSIYVLIAAVSLHSHASSNTVFNGLNFAKWKEQVNFHLGVLDLDLALLEAKPADLTES